MNNVTDWSVAATSEVFAVNQGRREYERGRVAGVGSSRPPVQHLTAREREIVQLLVEGQTNKEVAVALGVSLKTVDAHRANVMHKLDLHSVTDLVRYAIRNQIIAA
jgi:DNA-binding CsgD family transcriptional regulator